MKKTSVFQHLSYKAFLEATFRDPSNRGALSRAAEVLNCQRSYLSRVLRSESHLSLDQAFLLGQHLGLNQNEKDYFQLLVESERAGNPEYKKHLANRLAKLRKQHESLSDRTKRPAPSGGYELTYFSSWHWAAIHMLTSVPEFQEPAKLANRLGLQRETLSHYLVQLEKWGLIQKAGASWKYLSGEVHIEKTSPLVNIYHQNWRSRALLDAQNPYSSGVHFTNVQTLSQQDFGKLKEMVLNFISESNSLLGPSDPQTGVVVSLDLFEI